MITQAELAELRGFQRRTLPDLCRIWRWVGYADAIGAERGQHMPDSATVPCGFGWAPRREHPAADMTEVRGEFRLRLPAGTAIGERDRVEIVERMGRAEDADGMFEVDGVPARGPSGIVVWLKKVTI